MQRASLSHSGLAVNGDVPAIKVLIVDDQQMFREGIRNRLQSEADIEVVGEAGTAAETMTQIQETGPNTVILDIRMPDVSGIEVAKAIRRDWPELKILILTGYDFDQYVRASARAGIDGYLLKDAPQEDLVNALREIAAGGAVLPPKIASKVMKTYAERPSKSRDRQLEELTVRAIEVLELIFQGMRNTEIAERLTISARTVEAHVRSIIGKLGAQSRTEAVRIAVEMNLIQ